MRKLLLIGIAILLLIPQSITSANAKSIQWDGADVVPGQLGKMTFTKDLKVYKREKDGRLSSMIVKRNAFLRVYNQEFPKDGVRYLWMSNGYRVQLTDLVVYKELPDSIYQQLNGTTIRPGDSFYISNPKGTYSYDQHPNKHKASKNLNFAFLQIDRPISVPRDGYIQVHAKHFIPLKDVTKFPSFGNTLLYAKETYPNSGTYGTGNHLNLKPYTQLFTVPNSDYIYVRDSDGKQYFTNRALFSTKPIPPAETVSEIASPDALFKHYKGDFETNYLTRSTLNVPRKMVQIGPNKWRAQFKRSEPSYDLVEYDGTFEIQYEKNDVTLIQKAKGYQFYTDGMMDYQTSYDTHSTMTVPFPLRVGSKVNVDYYQKNFKDLEQTEVQNVTDTSTTYTITKIVKNARVPVHGDQDDLIPLAVFAVKESEVGSLEHELILLSEKGNYFFNYWNSEGIVGW